MGCTSFEGRIPNTVYRSETSSFSPSSQRISRTFREQGEIPGSPEGSRRVGGEGGDRNSKVTNSRVLQQVVSSAETGGKMAPCFRCIKAQQVCGENKILDGNESDSKGGNKESRLDGVPGHERRILSCTHSSSIQEIPPVCLQQQDISIQGNVLRAKHSSTSFHEDFSTVEQDNALGWFQNYTLSRRLVNPGQLEGGDAESHNFYSESDKRIRNSDKLRKVKFGAITIHYLSGDDDRFNDFLGFSSPETDRESIQNLRKVYLLRTNACKILATTSGTHVRSGEVCPWCQATHETIPVLPQKGLEERLAARGYFNPSSDKPQRRSCLVVGRRKTEEGSYPRAENPRGGHVLGRFQTELGSDHRASLYLGNMDTEGEKGTHQQARVEGHLLCPTEARKLGQRKDGGDLCGQHHSSVLHKETRGNEVMGAIQVGGGATAMGGRERDNSNSEIYRGKKEQCGGHSEQEGPSGGDRMDPKQTGMSGSVESMGKTPSGRICHSTNKEVRNILCPTLGSKCARSGCAAAKLEPSGSICIPSICSNQKGVEQAKELDQLPHDSSSPVVATKGVVPRLDRSASRSAKGSTHKKRSTPTADDEGSTSRSGSSSSDRLETVISLSRKKGLSEKVSKRIFNARATSTNALYQIRWKTYVKWCRKNKVSAVNPSVNSLCKFFIHLWEDRKLAVGTIKGFRSVLQSVLRHNNLDISNNQDITDVIKSFIIEKPLAKKDSINWNVDVVLSFLCSGRFEPLSGSSLRDLTRKTLFLLALALAKRVSELQALSSNVGFTKEGAVVSLMLGFRAKNDNKMKRLPRNFLVKSLTELVGPEEERKLCPVRALREYLDRTKGMRQGENRNLFLAPRDTTRVASKNALGYLMKSTIVEAHKDVSPETLKVCKARVHDVRAVGTSLAFAHNLSIESVLEAAQWRSDSVFTGHYLKEVSIQYESCRTLGPMVAAGTVIL